MSATPPPAAVELKFQIVRFWQSFLKSAAAASNRDVRSRPITSSSAATGRRGTSTLLARYIPSSSDTSGHAACKAESSRLVYASGSVRSRTCRAIWRVLVISSQTPQSGTVMIASSPRSMVDTLICSVGSVPRTQTTPQPRSSSASPRLVAQPVGPHVLLLGRHRRPANPAAHQAFSSMYSVSCCVWHVARSVLGR